MSNDNHQRTRRCIAKTRSGSQCKNTINCSHHRCKGLACAGEISHTRRDIPLTPLSIRQEYLAPERSHTPIASRSLNDSSQCGTITVAPRPDGIPDQNETHHHSALPPAGSVRISEGDRTENDDRQGASGLGHAQSGLTRHESEVTPLLDLLDSSLDERLLESPVLDPTPSDLNLEAGVTAKGKEKERRHSNGQDSGHPASTSAADLRDILPSPSPEASITAKGKERERRDSNMQDSGSPTSTPVANLRGIDPTYTDINPEAGMPAKGKEKERVYSNERDYNNTGYPASTSVASSRRIVPGPSPETGVTAKGKEKEKSNSNMQDSGNPASTSVAKLLGIDHSTLEESKRQAAAILVLLNASRIIITSETNVDQLKAIEIQEDTLDETNYDNEPSLNSPSLSRAPTPSSTTDPDQSNSPAPAMIQSEDTARQSLTPLSYDSEPRFIPIPAPPRSPSFNPPANLIQIE